MTWKREGLNFGVDIKTSLIIIIIIFLKKGSLSFLRIKSQNMYQRKGQAHKNHATNTRY